METAWSCGKLPPKGHVCMGDAAPGHWDTVLNAKLAELELIFRAGTPESGAVMDECRIRLDAQIWRTGAQNWRTSTQNWRGDGRFSAPLRHFRVLNS